MKRTVVICDICKRELEPEREVISRVTISNEDSSTRQYDLCADDAKNVQAFILSGQTESNLGPAVQDPNYDFDTLLYAARAVVRDTDKYPFDSRFKKEEEKPLEERIAVLRLKVEELDSKNQSELRDITKLALGEIEKANMKHAAQTVSEF